MAGVRMDSDTRIGSWDVENPVAQGDETFRTE